MIHLDAARRQEAMAAGWQAYREHVPGHQDAWERACQGWDVLAVCADDDVIGALLAKDGVIHLGIVPEWRSKWASRRIIRDMMKHGAATKMRAVEPSADFVARVAAIGGLHVVRR